MSVDFKTALNNMAKKDFEACVIDTYNQIANIIQDEVSEGNTKVSIELVVGYNPFTSYCDIAVGDVLSRTAEYWEKNSGKEPKAMAKQIEEYDLYYHAESWTPWYFAFHGMFGLNKTGKLFAEELQRIAEKENIVLKNFKPVKKINIPTLIEFQCQYEGSSNDSMPKKFETAEMKQALDKADDIVKDALKKTSLSEINVRRLETMNMYDFCFLRKEKEYKTQISVACSSKEIVVTESVFVGKFYIEKQSEFLELCENYNEDEEDNDSFELNCYKDRSVYFTKCWGIDFNHPNCEKVLRKNIESLNQLLDERIVKVCCEFVE